MPGSRLRWVGFTLLASLLVGVPGAEAASPSPMGPSPAASHGSAAPDGTDCTNPEGGLCLGALPGGTYTTQVSVVPITYTVPDGWANWEDTPGNFLLVPPGQTLDGVNAGTSDFIGIYRDVVAPAQDCQGRPEPGVGTTAKELADHIASLPGLVPATPQPVTIGGLEGYVVDAVVSPDWTVPCPYSNGVPVVDLLLGDGVTSFLEHNVATGAATRLFFLDDAKGNIAIEVASVPVGMGIDAFLAAATPVVDGLRFGAP